MLILAGELEGGGHHVKNGADAGGLLKDHIVVTKRDIFCEDKEKCFQVPPQGLSFSSSLIC